MANQPLAFAELAGGGILLLAGFTGSSLGDILRGNFSLSSPAPLTGGASSGSTAITSGVATGTGGPNTGANAGRLTSNQAQFGTAFAKATGLNQDVVNAWLLHEQTGDTAVPGGNNWLNIQYTDQGPNSTYYQINNLGPVAAANASAQWLKQNQPSILASARQSIQAQVQAIENSGWASSHYGYASAQQFLGG